MDMENTILKQIQQNLDALQKQIDSMKPSETALEIPELSGGMNDKLKEKSDELTQIMREIINKADTGVFMSAVISVNGENHGGIGETVFYSADGADKIEQIDENKVAAAFEAFSSPKRINILKALMAKKLLSSNELTIQTRCIGGQLYHHLSILENAKIICKNNEMYSLTDSGRNITNTILCMVFGEPCK